MFTGIIQNTGYVSQIVAGETTAELFVRCDFDFTDLTCGDSIAIDGVCLTLKSFETATRTLVFDLGYETLSKTTLASIKAQTQIHVEKALRLSDRLGGHLVQGHVDGTGKVAYVELGDCRIIKFTCPESLLVMCVPKGSIAISGVSLTINHVFHDGFDVCLIPETLRKTTFAQLKPGDSVNIENDIVGKYIRYFFDHAAKPRLLEKI